MKDLFSRLKNSIYYSFESIKNRYPCRILKVKNEIDLDKKTRIIYQAVTKLNIRELPIQELVSDSLLVEKFHPTDCIKLGFLCASEILIKSSQNLEEAKEQYIKIVKEMFDDLKD